MDSYSVTLKITWPWHKFLHACDVDLSSDKQQSNSTWRACCSNSKFETSDTHAKTHVKTDCKEIQICSLHYTVHQIITTAHLPLREWEQTLEETQPDPCCLRCCFAEVCSLTQSQSQNPHQIYWFSVNTRGFMQKFYGCPPTLIRNLGVPPVCMTSSKPYHFWTNHITTTPAMLWREFCVYKTHTK